MSSSSSSSSSSKASKPSKKNRSNKTKKSKKQKNERSVTNNLPGRELVQSYLNSLNNPFEDNGCKLGWGCLVPSSLVTAYVKGTLTANADGTLGIVLLPMANNIVSVASGGLNVSFATTAISIAAADGTAIGANYSTGRIISGGIRAYPSIALTSAPGAVYAGAIPTLTYSQAMAMTPNDLSTSPYMKQFRSYEGATATLRPQDTFSFEFDTRNVSTTIPWTGNNDLPVSVPFLAFYGIPASSTVFYEAVLNMEAIGISQHSSAALAFGDKQSSNSLADYFPSVEKLWSLAKPFVASAGRYGAAAALQAASIYAGGSKMEQLKFPGKAFRL
jgi:hypothetical protein